MDVEIKHEPSSIIVDGFELAEDMQPQQPSTSIHPYGYGYHNSSAYPPDRHTHLTSEDLYQFDEMQRLLKEWGLEVLSERFVQNLIDVSVLDYIVEMDIVDLCKDLPIRFRLILRHKLKQQNYKPTHVTELTIATNNKKSHIVPGSSYNPAKQAKCNEKTSPVPHTSSKTSTTMTKNPTTEIMDGQSNNATEKPQLITGQFKLVDLLQQYESGRLFLDQYKIENGKRIYSADSRNQIKKAVVDHYFRLGRGHISTHQFREMVQLIVDELPDEDPNIWYCVPNADLSLSPRGLLYTRYRYISQTNKQYKKQKDDVVVHYSRVLAQQAKDTWEALNGIDQTACLVAKAKLKEIENVDAKEVINAWKASYPLRRYEATMGLLQLNEFQSLTKFERVHDLITLDFCLIHSIASEFFYERIPHFVDRFKTVYVGYKSLIEEDKVLPSAIVSAFMEHKEQGLTEKMIFLAFYSLPHILRQNFLGGKGRKRRKLSTMQSRLSFITLLSAEYMLVDCVEDRRRTAAENDNPNRPFIIAIGSLAGDIRSFYVVLDELIFPCKTIVQAVDLLFKLYTVFHMDYAQECECVLRFIQGYLYKLKFQGDLSNTLATAVITDFNRL
ncbi:uncharacterized protein LOC135712733 [Ochlerotatus camptorhynchus]|uniref:uncharacterized protein LOC135712733 n=1 Tax=Ochlerotatus camptorhynchus TaxID=644619 RepID=UPI0031D83AD1